MSSLGTGYGFRFVPLKDVDALVAELQLKPGQIPKAEELSEFGCRLGAHLVVSGSLSDYGKVRWAWLLTGMPVDMMVDNAWSALKTLPEEIRDRKEVQLELKLAETSKPRATA